MTRYLEQVVGATALLDELGFGDEGLSVVAGPPQTPATMLRVVTTPP